MLTKKIIFCKRALNLMGRRLHYPLIYFVLLREDKKRRKGEKEERGHQILTKLFSLSHSTTAILLTTTTIRVGEG